MGVKICSDHDPVYVISLHRFKSPPVLRLVDRWLQGLEAQGDVQALGGIHRFFGRRQLMRQRQQATVGEARFSDSFGEKLRTLPINFTTRIEAYPRDVAARTRQTRYYPGSDWIAGIGD